ncbi:MAG: HEAT repeat domain-containing protein [Candidatus Gastranaerophilales bacterium]
MGNDKILDFEQIAENCLIFRDGKTRSSLVKLSALDDKFNQNELVAIYNYILGVSKKSEILMHIIHLSDRFRDKLVLDALIDILLMRNLKNSTNREKEAFINVRVMATKAIANLKDTLAVTPLLYCLNNKDENYKIRLACADALGKIGDRFAVAPLIEVMKDEDEKSVYLRESAASALGMLGDIRAVDSLVGILEGQKGIWSKFTFLKERVIEALSKMRVDDDERVFKAFKNSLLDESPQIRINAIEALMEMENPKSVDIIKDCLKDSDNEVKKNALIALYNLTGRKILDEVIADIQYSDYLKMEAVSLIDEYENDGSDDEDCDD